MNKHFLLRSLSPPPLCIAGGGLHLCLIFERVHERIHPFKAVGTVFVNSLDYLPLSLPERLVKIGYHILRILKPD
ncbi:MAG: hypothetical protein A4E57_04249 [Syntrophorhabdaceae bacterium PtaU1.Bin034]|nr:MAG: hypothetical protein A4E57_04249 [Syntrophorhabdaceae bacterium PtaU1.Bin034]